MCPEGAFCNYHQEEQALLCIQEHDSKHLLIQKLHVGTGLVDRFGIVEYLKTSMFTLCDHRHRKSGHDNLGFALRKELAELLKRSA